MDAWLGRRKAKNEYKSLATRLSLWGQSRGVPGASPAWATRLAHRIASSSNPKLTEHFIRAYKIDYAKATKCSSKNTAGECAAKYGSLNEFFTRHIKDIMIQAGDIVSPATCKAVVYDTFESSRVWVKGLLWSAPRLLRMNASFQDHAVGIFRLRPADYHRFHIPSGGRIASIRHIQGTYLSVDPIVVGRTNVLTENNRVVVTIKSPLYGTYYVIAVGAAGVGRVVIERSVNDTVRAGEPLGAFEFGGSTVVVLIPNKNGAAVWDSTYVAAAARGNEVKVDIGTRMSVR